MTYHESRMPLGVSEGVLSALTPEELAAAGIKASDFSPANWKAAQGPDGKQYAVPLDIHSIILYYNKDMLKKAGLLGEDGKPKGLDGVGNFNAALAKLTANGVYGLSVPNGGRPGWRIFYTLLNQQDGEFLKDGKFLDGDNLAKADDRARRDAEVGEERMRRQRTPSIPPRLRSSLRAKRRCISMASGRSRRWSTWLRRASCSTGARSRSRCSTPILRPGPIPTRSPFPIAKVIPLTPPSAKLVLDAIHWFNEHSLEWAGGGHVPAYLPVQDSAEFKALKPNSDYVSLAKTAVFDPVSIYAGVASPVYDAAGNYMIPALNGEIAPADAAKKIRDDLQAQAKWALEPLPRRSVGPKCRPAAFQARGGERQGDAEEQTHRDPCRRRSDGAVRRHLRDIVRLSDHQDGGAQLYERSADRTGQVGGARQLFPTCL